MSDHLSRRELVVSAAAIAACATLGCSSSGEQNQSSAKPLSIAAAPSPDWPVLKTYDESHLTRLAMPIGGIGTGTISLGGRGDLRDWEIVNRPAKGYAPPNTFFALWAKPQASNAITRALEGPIDPIGYEGASGAVARNHGLPRFRHASFAAAYPLGQVLLADPDVPLGVRIEAFNPMIPADADRSGIPIGVLRFVLTNPTSAPIDAAVCGNLENFIGWDGVQGKTKGNFNEFRAKEGWPIRGLVMQSQIDPQSPAWGTLALTTTATDVTYRTGWTDLSWGDTLLDWWDDFSADGKLDNRESKREPPFGSLAANVTVAPGATQSVTFLITWHFPNRLAWNPPFERVGNFYATQFADAWDVAVRTAPQLPDLERDTVKFVKTFVESDLPEVVKEAALFNASTLRTQTCFRAEDGRFFGFEGCNDHDGCCHGSCTHVWNYDQATPFLYGALSRSMREVEFGHATRDSGYMSFRVNLPLMHAQEAKPAAADGQMGSIMRLYRTWRLSGDTAMLKKLWPRAKKAMEFAWSKGGWDADKDGVMEGCQHNTMDVEYYGPNPEIGVWYLGALRACEEMAKFLGDADFAATCHDLFERGSKWLDANLFNGEYYEHRIVPAKSADSVADGLRLGAGAADPTNPVLQIGAGCLADQLVGQCMAHVCGLGYLLDRDHVRTTMSSIMKHNFREGFYDHFNPMRSYALNDEAGLLVATYPRGQRPARPFPYASEVWTGIEYTAAAGMIFEGETEDAMKIIAAVRARHDGKKRNPFDEPECGHHYARAMASWGAIIALTGFHYDAIEERVQFAASLKPVKWFWSTGDAWGLVQQTPKAAAIDVRLKVLGGRIQARTLALAGVGEATLTRSEGDFICRVSRGAGS